MGKALNPAWLSTRFWVLSGLCCVLPDVDVLMVPLPGHSRGHVGVAVNTGSGWLLHCGDAYFHRSEVTGEGAMPAGLKLFERSIQVQPRQRENTRERLAALHRVAAAAGSDGGDLPLPEPAQAQPHAPGAG